jgi:hypothetical protein
MRRWVVGAALVAAVALALPVRADDAMWRAFRGRVMFSDVALAPASSFGNTAMMESALRRIARANLEQNAGFWRIHMLVFLDRPAPTGTLVMRASDVTDARAPRQVRVFEVPVERGDRELRLDDFVVNEAMGFQRDVTYQFAIEVPSEPGNGAAETGRVGRAGKADVLAKGVITLR